MAEQYYSILTNKGKELEAASSASGIPVVIKDFVIGDGGGQAVTPDPARTALVHEVYRGAISSLEVSPDQPNQWIAHIVIPADIGGFTMREGGLLTDAGELYSVANSAAIEKPESGININLQYRLAVSETASIELKVATGDGLFLRQDANLSDVKDKATSRKNLDLKGAALLDVGITAGTVAAGNDTRIVNALQKTNNLSDLVDKAVARTNLGLGTAATANVQTSKDDVTAGRVLANGGALALRSVRASQTAGAEVVSANDLPINAVSFTYSDALNGPGITASLISFSGLSGNYPIQFSAAYSNGGNRALFRTYNGDAAKTWNPWFEFYHTGNKPTPAEVGAVAKAGDTMTGPLTVPILSVKQKTANTAFVLYFTLAEGGNLGYIGQGTSTKDIHIVNYVGANNFALKADGGVEIRGNSATANISVIGNLNPTSFVTFDGRYQSKGSYYNTTQSDARYQKTNTALRAANGWYKDTNTGIIFQWGVIKNSTIGNNTVTFPIAFPSACLNVQNTIIRPSGNAGQDNWSMVTGFTTTTASIGSDQNGSYWYAIGY
jgi:hypothetical protein